MVYVEPRFDRKKSYLLVLFLSRDICKNSKFRVVAAQVEFDGPRVLLVQVARLWPYFDLF